MKPYGKLTVHEDEASYLDGPSEYEIHAAKKAPSLGFEAHENATPTSDETLSLLFSLVKNLSVGVDELSDKVHKSKRFFDAERIQRELFAHNEQFLKNIIQSQTTMIVDQVVTGLSNKVVDGLSGYLTQMLNQEKKSSELLLNVLNYRFCSLDEQFEKLNRSILAYAQKAEIKSAQTSDLESARTEMGPTPFHKNREMSFKNMSRVKASALGQDSPSIPRMKAFALNKPTLPFFHRVADGVLKFCLKIVSKSPMILIVIIACFIGLRIPLFSPDPSGRQVTQGITPVPLPQNPVTPEKQGEDLDSAYAPYENEGELLSQKIQEPIAAKPPTVDKDMSALERLLPKTYELTPLREAVLSGDSLAMYEMGVRFLSGKGVKRTPELATRLFEKAVDYHSPFAAYQLASQYEKGVGVPRDVEKSVALYEKAANAGHIKAMHNLGVLIAEGGAGGKPDYGKAIEWFQKAADHGLKDSQYNLGILLAHGLGAPQDRVEAYKWFDLASQKNDAESLKKRDTVAKKMNTTDIALARVRSSQWRAKESPLTGTEGGAFIFPWTSKNSLLASKEEKRP